VTHSDVVGQIDNHSAVDLARCRDGRPSAARTLRRLGLLGAATFGAVHYLGRTWGADEVEQRAVMPGDDIVARPFGITNHAITIDATPAMIWPWIVQMGYHRAGWYTPRWVDRWIWHIENPTVTTVHPELQNVHVGDVIPDGEPGTAFFRVADLKEDHFLVLHSTTHLPPALRDRTWVDWTWSFLLTPIDLHHTRLKLRVRATGSPELWLAWTLFLVPSDLVMARSMLRGIKRRAEATGTGHRTD